MSETTPTKKTTGAMDSSPAGSGLLAGKTLLVTGVLGSARRVTAVMP